MQREETVTVVDFLAMCGGVLGLFMGFSVMTIVEYIYYPFLRLYCTIQRLKKEDEEKKEKEKSKEGANGEKKKSADLGVRQSDSRKWKDRLKNYLLEYCDNSNIHGMRYFSLPGLHWSERCYWAVFCVASLALCTWMTYNVWIQWQANPVLIKPLRNDPSRIPQPTVTICPQVKAMKQKLDLTSALSNFSNLSDTETQRLNALANVCPLLPNFVAFGDRYANESIYDTIQDISPQFKDTVIACSLDGRTFQQCYPQVSSVFTDEGLCFASNALDSQIVYTNEMAPEMKLKKHPTRLLSGFFSVSILVSIDKRNFDRQCNHFDGAFKVTLTESGEVLKMSRKYFRIHLGKRNTITYESKVTEISDGLLSYTPDQRQCFHPLESPLRFFKIYRQANCEEECLANFTSLECGCVHFSMPRDNETKVCGGASIPCMKAAKRKLLTDESGLEFHSKCNCLKACASIEYKADIQRVNLRFPHNSRKGFALVNLEMRNVESFERVEKFTTIDFLAVCGGLLGECLGVSVLSIVEIIFFVTLRLFFVIRSWISQNTAVHPVNQESFKVIAIVHHV